MTTVVIECVALSDLPAIAHSRVTVRIEEEPEVVNTIPGSDNPLFGLWKDRDDLIDVETYVSEVRGVLAKKGRHLPEDAEINARIKARLKAKDQAS